MTGDRRLRKPPG